MPILPNELGLLVILDALLETRSVTRAARGLGLSTPAMSQALARVRRQFGDPMLVRAGREMVLTPRGEALRPEVRRLVASAERLIVSTSEIAPEHFDETVTLHATDHMLTVMGRGLDRSIREAAPSLRLRVLPTSPDDATSLREGTADIAVGIYGALPPEIMTRRLFTDRLVCVVREDHPTVGERISLEQLAELEHVQVVPRGYPGGYIDTVLAEHGVKRRVTRALPFFLGGLFLISETDQVLIGPERVARAMAGRFRLKILEAPLPLLPYSLSMIWHPRTNDHPAQAWLREVLVREATHAAPEVHEHARNRLDDEDPMTGSKIPKRTKKSGSPLTRMPPR